MESKWIYVIMVAIVAIVAIITTTGGNTNMKGVAQMAQQEDLGGQALRTNYEKSLPKNALIYDPEPTFSTDFECDGGSNGGTYASDEEGDRFLAWRRDCINGGGEVVEVTQ